MKKLLSCVLAFLMIFGTCTTTFAALFTEAEIAYVDGLVDDAKAEINEIIDIAQNGTDAQKEEKVNEYIDAVKAALVVVGLNEAKIDEVEAEIRAEVDEIVAIVEAGNIDAANDKADAYIDYVKSLFDLTPEEDAFVDDAVDKIRDEIGEIAGIVEAQDDEAAKAKIDAYIDYIKGALNVTAEDEAKIAEAIADITALVEEIKGLSAEEVKATVDGYIAELKAKAALEYAKLGHKHYEKGANSKYVAIGGDTVLGGGLTYPNNVPYYGFVGQHYGITAEAVAEANLIASNVLNLITNNAANIASADLITYQMDASSIIYATLSDTPDWDKYLDAETKALIDKILSEIENALTTDLQEHANEKLDEIIPKIKVAVLEKLPEEIPFAEEIFDLVVDIAVPYVMKAVTYIEEKQQEIASKVESIDEMVWDYAEKLAYAVVSYAAETAKAIKTIETINPDATLVVVGMYNSFDGLEVIANGETINVGEIFEYVIDATNLYYATLAAADGGFAFVDVSDATTNGFSAPIDATALEIGQIAGVVLGLSNSMLADAAGHQYIKEQIIDALTCDYSAYAQLDATYHNIVCKLCGDVKGAEVHAFVGNTCSKCGYVKESSNNNNNNNNTGNYGGGGAGVSVARPVASVPAGEVEKGTKVELSTKTKDAEIYYTLDDTTPSAASTLYAGAITINEDTTIKAIAVKGKVKSSVLTVKYTVKKEEKVPNFLDLEGYDWAKEAILALAKLGIIKGVSDTEFAPGSNIKRADYMLLLVRMLNLDTEVTSNFDDVTADKYYYEGVGIAKALGLTTGVGDNKFNPEASITRQDMFVLAHRILQMQNAELIDADESAIETFDDYTKIADYAKDALASLVKNELVKGSYNNINPVGNATRAETAVFVYRLYNLFNN